MKRKQPTDRDRLLASLALITVAALWGIAAPIVKLTYREIPPFTFLFFRFLIATIVIIPIYALSEEKQKLTSKDFLELSGLGFLGMTLTIGLIFYGLKFTTAIDQVLIGILGPLFIVAGGAIFLKEEITKLEQLGLLSALLGSIITIIQPILEKGFAGKEAMFGNMIILASCITWAIYAVLAKRRVKKYSPMLFTTIPTGISVICFGPLFIIEYLNNPTVIEHLFTPLAVFGILYMALLSYILAYFLFQWGLKKIEASEAAVFGYLGPIFAYPVAYIFLDEKGGTFFFVGAALIAAGVFFTEWKPRWLLARERVNRNRLIQKLRSLNLPDKDYAIFGSGPLLAHGIIKTPHDIDIIARGEAWKKALKLGKLEKAPSGDKVVHPFGNRKIEIFKQWVPHRSWDVDEIINRADVIDGVRFAKLEDVLEEKRLMKRPKDRKHVRLIEKYLEDREN